MSLTRIVVPCYNEATRLDGERFLRFGALHPGVLFLFVNDGSTDRTASLLDDLRQSAPERIEVLHLPANRGKAEAVRQGMVRAMEAGGTAAGFWDADLATPLEAIPPFRDILRRLERVDLVLGTRLPLLGRQIRRNRLRHALGRVFARCASQVIGASVYDTQCGAKLFRITPVTRSLFQEPFLSRWIFDVELLVRWRQLCRSIGAAAHEQWYELPLDEWREVRGSKLKSTDFLRAIGELWAIRRRYAGAVPLPPDIDTSPPERKAA
jgi:glycosyltransferase involved in cell wall biosynthesis